MLFCDRLKSDNAKLSALLEEKDAEVKTLKEEVELLGIKYENLKMARALSSQDGQGAEKAKARLAKLVRDVDKCIAMLKN